MKKLTSLAMGRKIFYGWYIVAGATMATFMGTTLGVFATAVLLKPMTSELGWTRTDFFLVQPLAAIVGATTAPFVGRRIDRGNPRLLMLVGTLVMGSSVLAYSQVHSLWLFLLLAGVVTPAGLSLCGMAVLNAIIGKWFVRKRGRAIATAQAGINLGGIFVPPSVVALLALFGWRLTWIILGLAALAFMVTVAVLVRRAPEDMGLNPDGDAQPRSPGSAFSQRQEREWGWRQLLRTRTFWTIAIVFGLTGMGISGTAPHTYIFFTDNNIEPAVAATMISMVSISGLALRPMWGYILERWDLRHASLLAFLAYGLSVAGVVLTRSIPLLFVSMAVRGVSSGGISAVGPMLYGHHFGRRSLGQVLGVAHLVALPFSIAGPILSAQAFDRLHSYILIFSIFGALFVVASVIVFYIRPPSAAVPVGAAQATQAR